MPAETRAVVQDAVAALRAGGLVVLPTDTVYGLCASPYREREAVCLARAKGRSAAQPIALVASDFDTLFECLPEVRAQAGLLRALLPGKLTLVVPNPRRRYRWLTGENPDAIGVRIPGELPKETRAVLRRVGCFAATSANRTGERDPARLEDVPEEIRARCRAVINGTELPGIPSTVVDLTRAEPVVLREGAVSTADVLARLSKAAA